jgi:hypothetical protein
VENHVRGTSCGCSSQTISLILPRATRRRMSFMCSREHGVGVRSLPRTVRLRHLLFCCQRLVNKTMDPATREPRLLANPPSLPTSAPHATRSNGVQSNTTRFIPSLARDTRWRVATQTGGPHRPARRRQIPIRLNPAPQVRAHPRSCPAQLAPPIYATPRRRSPPSHPTRRQQARPARSHLTDRPFGDSRARLVCRPAGRRSRRSVSFPARRRRSSRRDELGAGSRRGVRRCRRGRVRRRAPRLRLRRRRTAGRREVRRPASLAAAPRRRGPRGAPASPLPRDQRFLSFPFFSCPQLSPTISNLPFSSKLGLGLEESCWNTSDRSINRCGCCLASGVGVVGVGVDGEASRRRRQQVRAALRRAALHRDARHGAPLKNDASSGGNSRHDSAIDCWWRLGQPVLLGQFGLPFPLSFVCVFSSCCR